MTNRTGSFALMNLAQDYGVAYADVLVWMENLRRERCGERVSQGQLHLLVDALENIVHQIGIRKQHKLMHAMVDLANARWGDPPMEYA